jgi:DNA (cytosine-5)-methyltransferase 1
MNHLDLFSGIGGFKLASDWVWGKESNCVGFVEIDPFCQKVLNKHWPEVTVYDDITGFSYSGPQVDLITGGFPCQDISIAGKGVGIEGERSGLWSEFKRIISECRPKFALIENVPILTHRGLDRVLCDLAEIGYDAEWQCISAAEVGAWHKRERIWIVAYPQKHDHREFGRENNSEGEILKGRETKIRSKFTRPREDVPDPTGSRLSTGSNIKQGGDILSEVGEAKKGEQAGRGRGSETGEVCETVPNTESKRCEKSRGEATTKRFEQDCKISDTTNARAKRVYQRENLSSGIQWKSEPELGRVAHGVPNRVDRLKGLGNAIVPQVAYIIMQQIKLNLTL